MSDVVGVITEKSLAIQICPHGLKGPVVWGCELCGVTDGAVCDATAPFCGDAGGEDDVTETLEFVILIGE